ncbi:guanylate kinase [Aquimarina agarivorans]|uniref:guanylate kinase n=1 Tax=Aquimarina agarivorans TaxID=980584 RepID=UPI000248FCA5|nr:guanylate kinase [Aquimarina agarivorans]
MNKGKLIVFSAPSGSGKTTIVQHLLRKTDLALEFSISATSRSPRGQEIDGKDYYFLSIDQFKTKIANDEFLEFEEVYSNNFYGTLKSEVERIWKTGKAVIFDIDVVGGLNIAKQFPQETLSIFVKPPNKIELEKRLRGRATETEQKIQMRLAKADKELNLALKFDAIITNDNLKIAKQEAYQLVSKFLK